MKCNANRGAAGRTLRQLFLSALLPGLLLAFLALNSLPAASQSAALTQEAFWQKVEQTRAFAQASPDGQDWEKLAKEWEAVQSVTLNDGQTVPVDTRQIAALLRKKPADPKAMGDYLDALQRSKARWSQGAAKTAELNRLREILARREFSGQPQNFLERMLSSVYDWLLDLLEKIFPSRGDADIPFIPSWLTVSLAVALLLGVLGYLFHDTWRNLLSEVELAEDATGEEEVLSAQQATRRAQQLSNSGDYRQAVRYLYLSALLLLDERGLLRYNRTQTNREYLRQVSDNPQLAGHLRSVVDTFDRVWYGYQEVDETEYSRYVEQVGELEEEKRE